MKKALLFLLVCLFLSAPVLAQQNVEAPKLRHEIVEVKYINANWALGLLKQYMSRNGKINQIPGTNKVIIEDTAEIVDKILSILEEVDAKPLDLQFNIDLLLGSTQEGDKTDWARDKKNESVLKELQGLLKYKSFRMLDSSILKVQDSVRSSQRIGGKGINLNLQLSPRTIKDEDGESFQLELRLSQYQGFKPDGNERTLTLIDTNLTLQSGERQVVGVSKLTYVPQEAGGQEEDIALIMILSGKVLK
jgi:hypothetical protein